MPDGAGQRQPIEAAVPGVDEGFVVGSPFLVEGFVAVLERVFLVLFFG